MASLRTPPCSPASDSLSCFVSPASSLTLSYSEPIMDHGEADAEYPQTLRNVSRRLSFSSISAKRSPKRSPRLSPALASMRTSNLNNTAATLAPIATTSSKFNTITHLSCDIALQSPAFASSFPSPSLSSRKSPRRNKHSKPSSHRCCDSVDSDFLSFKYDYDENVNDSDNEPSIGSPSIHSDASLSAFPYSAALDDSRQTSPISTSNTTQHIQRRPPPLHLGQQSNYANQAFAEHSAHIFDSADDSKLNYAGLNDVCAREPSIDSSSFRTSSDYDSTLESTGPLTPTKPYPVLAPVSTIDETIQFANSMYLSTRESPLSNSLWPDQFGKFHFNDDHSLSSNWKGHLSASITSTATTATCRSFTTVPELPADEPEKPKSVEAGDDGDFDTDTDDVGGLPSDCSLSVFPVPPTKSNDKKNDDDNLSTNISPLRGGSVKSTLSTSEGTPSRVTPISSRLTHKKSTESSSKYSSDGSSLDSSNSLRKSISSRLSITPTSRLSVTPKGKSHTTTKLRPASILKDFQIESPTANYGASRSPKAKPATSFLKELTLTKGSSLRSASTTARHRIKSFSGSSNSAKHETDKIELKISDQSLLQDSTNSTETPGAQRGAYLTDPWSDPTRGSSKSSHQFESPLSAISTTRNTKLFYSEKREGPLGKVIGETTSIKNRSSFSCDTKASSTSSRLSPSPRLSAMLSPCSISPIRSNFPLGATSTFIATRPAPVRLSASYPNPYPHRARSNSNLQSPPSRQSGGSPTPTQRTLRDDDPNNEMLCRGPSIDSDYSSPLRLNLAPDSNRKLSQSTASCMPSSIHAIKSDMKGNGEWVEYGYAL